MPAYKNISEYDLARCPGSEHPEQQKALLWQIGCDITKEIETLECEHRTIDGKVVFGKLFICFERTDKKWIQSGYASIDAKIAASADWSQRAEMRTMSTEGYQGKFNEEKIDE